MFVTWDHYREWLEDVLFDPQQVFPDVDIPMPSDFHTDSRTIKPGQWFVPIRGEKFDGHLFIRQTIKLGAAGFLYMPQHFPSETPKNLALGLPVKDTLKALQAIAHGWRRQLKHTKIAAITGSVGKTTAKNFLGCIVTASGESLVSQSSFNNEIGVPLNLLQLNSSHQYAVIEMGARHAGDIRFLAEMAEPNVAAVLNVGSSHVGEFGGRDILFRTKSEMFHHSPAQATLVVFQDQNDLVNEAKKTGKKLISFGTGEGAHVRVVGSPKLDSENMIFSLEIEGKIADFCMASLSASTPINAAAACAIALACGISVEKMQKGLREFRAPRGRFRPVQLKNFLMIDDAYNANPESMNAGLESVQKFFHGSSKGLIIGDMLELGSESQQAHYQIGKNISKISSLSFVWVVGKESEQFIRGAVDSGVDPKLFTHFAKVEDLLGRNIPLSSSHNPLVYIKASFGTGLHKLVTHLEKGL